jgi:hypothetical protein
MYLQMELNPLDLPTGQIKMIQLPLVHKLFCKVVKMTPSDHSWTAGVLLVVIVGVFSRR